MLMQKIDPTISFVFCGADLVEMGLCTHGHRYEWPSGWPEPLVCPVVVDARGADPRTPAV